MSLFLVVFRSLIYIIMHLDVQYYDKPYSMKNKLILHLVRLNML